MIKVRRGLNVPVAGVPQQHIETARSVRRVALLGQDYVGMKPTMEVQVGDRVKTGQVLFTDKKTPGVCFTSPGAGTVSAINRGERRAFLSMVIDVDGDDAVRFDAYESSRLAGLARDSVRDLLVESGLWTSFRTRPYSKTPRIDATPDAIFVTAIDTHPLAADPAVVLAEQPTAFRDGLKVLTRLTEGTVHLCCAPNVKTSEVDGVKRTDFSGPHPAGLVGTHIHMLAPVHPGRTVWHLGYQDVIAIGHLFVTGELRTERVVALGGPNVKQPRLLRTRLGASLTDLTEGELIDGPKRIVSGSLLSGREVTEEVAYLGRYHQQISVLQESGERIMFGWTQPGANKYSINRTFLSRYLPPKRFRFNTMLQGSQRAIVPIGSFERVMPLDMEPVYLLRALSCGDTDSAQQMGCLELDEEDLALCTFVCNGKNDYGPLLRQALTTIEKEG